MGIALTAIRNSARKAGAKENEGITHPVRIPRDDTGQGGQPDDGLTALHMLDPEQDEPHDAKSIRAILYGGFIMLTRLIRHALG